VPGPDPADSDEKTLQLVQQQEGSFATAPEIAGDMSVGEKQTRNRLDALASEDYLNWRRVGSTKVYWLSDKGERELANPS